MSVNIDESGRPWTVSGGGPIVVIAAELAGQWRGTSAPLGASVPPGWTWGDSGGPECDYDRACEPAERSGTPYGGFGWVQVDGQPVLILDAEILTFFVASADGGFLVRAAVEESDGNHDPSSIPPDGWFSVGPSSIVLTDGRLFMFDSASLGANNPEEIPANDGVGVVTLGSGRWQIDFATNEAEVDFVRFRRAD